MTFDLAMDFRTGDILTGPNNDLAARSGPDVIKQRIHIRLKIPRGGWDLDPSGGFLGSRLYESLRMSRERAVTEAEALVREALEPMTDLEVKRVDVDKDSDDANRILVNIYYAPLLDSSDIALADISSTQIVLQAF